MGYATIPESDAVLLARALGLLVSQAGIYGAYHNVTQSTARSVYTEIDAFLKKHGPVEFAACENRLLINGTELGATSVAGKNLYDRLALYKIGGFLFAPPLELHEFLFFVGLFGTPPLSLAPQGGFETVLKKTGFRSIQVVNVSYQRMKGDVPPAPAPETAKGRSLSSEAVAPKVIDVARLPTPPMSGVLDLSEAMSGLAPLNSEATDEPQPPPLVKESASAASRRERAQTLAAVLRDAASALESNSTADDPGIMNTVLDRIRDLLTEMTSGSRQGITTLACDLEEDSKTIASIESAARRRGIGLKLTRGELLQRYAELNQEIVQPLTVSSGVIDLLHSGKTGELSESQLELLKMAADSMDRVNQLVNYLNRVSGLPESLTPDARLLSDTYR